MGETSIMFNQVNDFMLQILRVQVTSVQFLPGIRNWWDLDDPPLGLVGLHQQLAFPHAFGDALRELGQGESGGRGAKWVKWMETVRKIEDLWFLSR